MIYLDNLVPGLRLCEVVQDLRTYEYNYDVRVQLSTTWYYYSRHVLIVGAILAARIITQIVRLPPGNMYVNDEL